MYTGTTVNIIYKSFRCSLHYKYAFCVMCVQTWMLIYIRAQCFSRFDSEKPVFCVCVIYFKNKMLKETDLFKCFLTSLAVFYYFDCGWISQGVINLTVFFFFSQHVSSSRIVLCAYTSSFIHKRSPVRVF